MSYETWKPLYYPVNAKDVTGAVELVRHALRKWEGLRPEVLQEHGLEVNRSTLIEWESETEAVTRLHISSDTCTLCLAYCQDPCTANAADAVECRQCPLFQVRDRVDCTLRQERRESVSPYAHFLDTKDPEPMINWLKEALDFEIARQNNKTGEPA